MFQLLQTGIDTLPSTQPLQTADIEDITSKTGSFKKFSMFVRMLQSAVLQQSDSVFVDLLTCQDLELLKAKKAAAAAVSSTDGPQQQPQQPVRQLPASLSSKRYLILTYASEFDRVHYPLPLLADEQPDPARLKAVIASLRQQLAAVQAGLPSPALLQPQGGQQLLASRKQRSHSRASEQVSGSFFPQLLPQFLISNCMHSSFLQQPMVAPLQLH